MKRTSILLIILLILLLPAGMAMAAPFDRIVGAGETVDEDITVMGNDLVVEEGGTVTEKMINHIGATIWQSCLKNDGWEDQEKATHPGEDDKMNTE